MTAYVDDLQARIEGIRTRAAAFFGSLRTESGYRYTATHCPEVFPAAVLYGTWSAILGSALLGRTSKWSPEHRRWVLSRLCYHRRADGAFLARGLESLRNEKPLEYLILHCTNYSLGAALELDEGFDFGSAYLDAFLDGDYLKRWLDARSLLRPWEEGNNVVNVTSYLALCAENGVSAAWDRLTQLLEWHRRHQNPETGGFDCFTHPSRQQRLQSLAGAVHNFHLHLFLKERLGCEEVIANSLPSYLFEGRLTACLSLDLTELATHTLAFSQNPGRLVAALLRHCEALLSAQRDDGGWLEADRNHSTTTAAGFRDTETSSCSYATWFRLCSLGMISRSLLGTPAENWRFRRTLGMGYAPPDWKVISPLTTVERPMLSATWREIVPAFGYRIRSRLVHVGGRLL